MSERQDSTPGPSATGYGTPGGDSPDHSAPDHSAPDHSAPDYSAPDATAPQYSSRPVAVRRPDLLAAMLLVLAGISAAISLVTRWVHGSSATGLDLVRMGFSSFGHLASTGLWQPLAVVLGGGVLFVIGLFVFLPARSHRFLGALALVVTAFVVAGVLVPLADAHWHTGFFDLGFWFACAVALFGLLGSLKALLTGRRNRVR